MAGSGVLKILIVGADNLDRIVTAGQQLPYYIIECGSQRSRSKPCFDNGINPNWNTAHKFNISDEVAVLAVIKDETTKGIIGKGIIDLHRAKQYGKDEGAVVLTNLGGNPAGTVQYKLKYSGAPGSISPAPAAAAPSPLPAAIVPPTQAPTNVVLRPPSETASNGGHYHPSPRAAPAPAVAPSPQQSVADDDTSSNYDDPMLAAVTNKVSLAKQAMQQLTAELAELTGADSAAVDRDAGGISSPYASRRPLLHSQSLWEQRGTNAMQQQFRSFRQPRVSAGSLSPGQVSPSHLSPQGTELAGYQSSWCSSAATATAGGMGLSGGGYSAEELLLRYGGEQAAEAQRMGSSSALIRQLQQALVAAHSEKVATEDELSNVREAMADLSKQHFDAVKRLRDAAGPAAAGIARPLNSTTSKHLQMVDTAPPRAHARMPRVSGDSVGSGEQQQQQGYGAAAAVGKEFNEGMGSPVPAYKLQIQTHQLERQLAEQTSRTQEEAAKRQGMAAQVAALQEKLDAQLEATRVSEANAKEAEAKAAQQATLAAAARAEAATVRESNKEAQLAGEVADLRIAMSDLRSELTAAQQEKDELEEALGLMEKNNSAQVAALQGELQQLREEASLLRAGNEHVASLQEQLAAARAEASGLRNTNEDVDYLQSQLRRTLRDNVELRHKLQMLQQAARKEEADGDSQEKEDHSAILTEHEALMTELVNTKLQLAELKEQQVRMQRQLYKAQQEGLIAM